MRIAYIVNYFPAISQTFVINQITGMLDKGHDVQIYANDRHPSCDRKKHEDIVKYDLMSRVHYFKIPNNPLKRVLPFMRLATKHLAQDSHSFCGSLNVLKYGKIALGLKLPHVIVHFMNEKFDIIHCHFGPPGILGACLKQLGVSGKLVVTFRGYDVDEGVEKGGQIYKRLFNHADLILAISDYNKKNVINFGANPKKVIYHTTGIELDKFSYNEQKSTGRPDKFIILTTARLVEKKALHVAIDAIRELHRKNPGLLLEYRIIGYGHLEKSLRKRVQNYNMEHIVQFLGPLREDEVIQQMRESHVFMLSSIKEGLGKSMLEAQAMGMPVIGTNAGGMPEAVKQNETGFIVPLGNSSAIAEKLDYLHRNYAKWHDIGKAGRKFIEKNYDVKRLNEKLEQHYLRLHKG